MLMSLKSIKYYTEEQVNAKIISNHKHTTDKSHRTNSSNKITSLTSTEHF